MNPFLLVMITQYYLSHQDLETTARVFMCLKDSFVPCLLFPEKFLWLLGILWNYS